MQERSSFLHPALVEVTTMGSRVNLAQRNASVGRKHFVARIALSIILPWTATGLVGMLALSNSPLYKRY